MSGSETVVPSELTGLAGRLDNTLTPLVAAARENFTETEVNGPAFSQDGLELQATYPALPHFALRDLQTKAQQIESIIERLGKTAASWTKAEHASTVTPR